MVVYNILMWLYWFAHTPFVAATWPTWPAAILTVVLIASMIRHERRHR
jgi:hypothetical protein